MQWIRDASSEVLRRLLRVYVVEWQLVAMRRELARRETITDAKATAAGMNRLFDGENVKDAVKK